MRKLIVFIVLFLVSCQDENIDIKYLAFNDNETLLVGEVVDVCEELKNVFHVKTIDTLIIGYNDSYTNPVGLVSFFSAKNYEHLGSFFSKGKGYAEFIETPTIRLNQKDIDGIHIVACSWDIPRFHYINITKCFDKKSIIIDSSFVCNNNSKTGFSLLGIDGNIGYIECSDEQSNKYIIGYNLRSNKIEKTIQQTDWDYHENNVKLNSGAMVLSSDKTKSIKGYLYNDKIEIRDLSKNGDYITLSTAKGGKIKSYNELINTSREELEKFYINVDCSDNLIFALRLKNPTKVTEAMEAPTSIEVFDINGNPLCLLTTKENLHHFALDIKNKFIYSIVKGEFYRYDISHVLGNLLGSTN